MKSLKYLIVSCFFVINFLIGKAGDFKGGLLAGFCASQMDGDKLAGYDKFGPTLGFFVNRNFKEKWNGQFEIRYNQKGAASVKNEESYRVRLNYIELPFLASYKITKRIKGEAGLEPSILISSKVLLVIASKKNLSWEIINIVPLYVFK